MSLTREGVSKLQVRRSRITIGLVITALAFSACASTSVYTPLLRAEPEIGGEFARAPRTLRLYYDDLPDVAQSSLTLTGPTGEYALRDLHTMADDDLMIEILEPLSVGYYTVRWTTVVGDDPTEHSGSFNFSVSSER